MNANDVKNSCQCIVLFCAGATAGMNVILGKWILVAIWIGAALLTGFANVRGGRK